jgi:hypothetical protein
MRAAAVAIVLAAAATACAGSGPLGPEYEYEEDLTLGLDGAATLIVNASVPALVALRGLPLSADPRTRGDLLKKQIEELYTSSDSKVGRISMWTRHGRRFVGSHLTIDEVRSLPRVGPFSWATYDLRDSGDQIVFREILSNKGVSGVRPPGTAWQGNEIVAFRLHLPARIRFQNSHYLDRPDSRPTSRGNILTWEQRLQQRLEGKPIAYADDRSPDVMEVRMDRQSILYRTLWLFGLAFVAAVAAIGGLIWLTMRRGRGDPSSSYPPPPA